MPRISNGFSLPYSGAGGAFTIDNLGNLTARNINSSGGTIYASTAGNVLGITSNYNGSAGPATSYIYEDATSGSIGLHPHVGVDVLFGNGLMKGVSSVPSTFTSRTQIGAGNANGNPNGILISSATTGNAPSISATQYGSDTNISLVIIGKGTGNVILNNNYCQISSTGSFVGNIPASGFPGYGVYLGSNGTNNNARISMTDGGGWVVMNMTTLNGISSGLQLTCPAIQLNSTNVGFYGAAPVVRAAAITQPASTAATNVAPYGYSTATQADAIRSGLQAVITALQNIGITS